MRQRLNIFDTVNPLRIHVFDIQFNVSKLFEQNLLGGRDLSIGPCKSLMIRVQN